MDTQKLAFTVMLMLAASALVAGTSLLAKSLGTDVLGPALNPFQITAGRYVFALTALVITTIIIRPKFTRPALHLHIGRAFAGSLGVTCMFAAATLIPLADATAISMLNPIIAMILAIPLLGESVGPRRWAAAALSVVGAILLIRPGASSFHPAALIALLSALVLAFEIIIVKLLSHREGTLHNIAVFEWFWNIACRYNCNVCLVMADTDAMVGTYGYRPANGLRPVPISSCVTARRRQFCGPAVLRNARICGALRFHNFRRNPFNA